MPLKLVPPRMGKSPFWTIRGTYLGVYVERSTKTTVRTVAGRLLKLAREEIECGATTKPGEATFLSAAVAYMAATRNQRFVDRLVEHFGQTALRLIDQQAIDNAAIQLYPHASPATRNRQVHTIVSAILKHAGQDGRLKRPKGWRGEQRTDWLKPEQAFRVFAAARKVDLEFAIFLVTLCYTGMRLSEATRRLPCSGVELAESFAYLAKTKNSDPRGVFLPPVVVAALAEHPRGLDRGGASVFRFRKNGRLYTLLGLVKKAAGPDVSFLTFHICRHTYGTWMRRYAGLDTTGLVATGTWRDPASARRYEHTIASEEAQRAELLPVEKSGTTVKGGGKPR